GGNKELYKKLLIKFQRDHSDSAEEINERLNGGKLKEAERSAHTIKGAAGTLGAGELQKAALNLEKGIKERKRDQYQGLLENFEKSLNKVMNSLKNIDPVKLK
ncbi:MAG: Hpt domain-containing protein, partial [Nitrospinota bacterium]